MIKNEHKQYIFFVSKFVLAFCLLYFGSLTVIALSAPEGYYSPLVAKYFDFITLLRSSYLHSCKSLLSLMNYKSIIVDKYTLVIDKGSGIRLVYSCIGYGVMSFWGAFIVANKASFKKKLMWLFSGWISIWCINVIRLILVLISHNKHWATPFGMDHHTLFNIVAYLFIFLLIYLYDKSSDKYRYQSNIPKFS